MLLLSIPFSLHTRCAEFPVCCACVAYKEARGKSHSTSYYVYTEEVQWGGLFPIKGLISSKHLLIVLLFRCLDQQYQSRHKGRLLFFFHSIEEFPAFCCPPVSALCLKTHACRSLLLYNVHLFCSCTSFDIVGLDYSPVFKLVCTNLGIYSHSAPIFRQKHIWHHV